jgi:hypothetical protein
MAGVPPYGMAVRSAVASGDVDKMREAYKQGEDYLQEYGNVSAALEALKIEIAKHEAGESS